MSESLRYSLSHKLFIKFIGMYESLAKSISPRFYFKTVAGLLDTLDRVYAVPIGAHQLKFRIDSDTVRVRVTRLLEREPETLRWIDGFAPDDVFWDIGSNIGIYSIYAAVKARARVVAFDPLPQNHATIVENIHINGLSSRIWPFCVALSDKPSVAELSVPLEADTAGGAGGVFGHDLDNHGDQVDAVKSFPAIGFSIDSFLEIFDVPFPTHLKMDIDGIQVRVIRGAGKTLRDSRLKSVMLELPPINTETNRQNFEFIFGEMDAAGFDFSHRVATPGIEADIRTIDTNNFFVRRAG